MKTPLLLILSILFRTFLCEEVKTGSLNCGGNFSGLQYPLTSPNYPKNYPPDKDCVYILKGSQSADCEQEFHLQFLDFQLEASEGCSKDYVRVGPDSIYCGNSVGIRKFRAQEKSLKLVFHSDKNGTAKGFRIIVTTLPCVEVEDDPKQNSSATMRRADVAEKKENLKISHPVLRPEVKFSPEGNQPKNPSENLELPEFERHYFHDENCGHANDGGIGSVTSYLYLPPGEITRPLKIANSGPEVVIGNFDEESRGAGFPTDPILPSIQIPGPFAQLPPKTRGAFQPPRISSQFYDPANRWLTYGTPNNYLPPKNPSINSNFDPLGNDNRNPSNCNNNEGGNWYPNYNPGENPSPVGPGVNDNYPNFGNGNGNNGYPGSGISFDQNPGYLPPNGNHHPNNNFYSPVDTTYYETRVSQCCGTYYSSSSFVLSSPGFPALIYSSSNYECQYTIRRSSESICGLEMYLRFFNFGSEDRFCAYGYVEINGNRICGCKTGANVTASFDNIATKTMSVKYVGYPRNKFSGFVIEVTQVACSTSYLRFGNDQSPILVRNYKRSVSSGPEEGLKFREKRDVENFAQGENENLAALRTSQNLLINTCRIFKFVNWVKAAKQVYLRSAQCSATNTGSTTNTGVNSAISVIPIFPETGNSALINYPSSANCQIVNVVDGTISSPYYPNSYSNDLNQCYRFFKAPGYCQLEIAVLDFDLESSTLCRKDYVSFSGQKRRYCGTSLSGTRTIFDMTQATFADLYFVTDSSGTGRGFRAGFTQISC